MCVKRRRREAVGGGEAGKNSGYRIKNKNPTQRCGEQFCETSSKFEVGSIKNEATLRDVLSFQVDNIKVKNETILQDFLQLPRTNAFCDFSTPPV